MVPGDQLYSSVPNLRDPFASVLRSDFHVNWGLHRFSEQFEELFCF